MPIIRIETIIYAPIGLCFDLMRDPDLHARSTAQSGERVVSRTGSGLLTLGDIITFEAMHFGVRQRLTAKITRYDPPYLFEDQLVRGAFQSFTHQHAFREHGGATVMTDTFAFKAPLGPLGRLAERLFLTRYMMRFLARRAVFLKQQAEAHPS